MRVGLLAHSLLLNLRQGRHCIVHTAGPPTSWLRKCQLAGACLEEFIGSGLLKLVHHPDSEVDPKDGTPGLHAMVAKRLLLELRHLRTSAGALVVFEQADTRLALPDPMSSARMAEGYMQWADDKQCAVLMIFAPRQQTPRDTLTLRTAAESFGGFAVLRTSDDEAVLDVRHWFSDEGVSSRCSFVVEAAPQGPLRARLAASASRLSSDPAREVMLATKRAGDDFPGIQGPGQVWQLVENYIEAIDRSRSLLAGTVVLHFERHAAFRELAQTVASIRGHGRAQVRLVVRESGARLRLPQMVALLRLGVSMFIPREVPGASAKLVADSLRGTLFTRPYESEVDLVLKDEVNPQRGMLSISAFRFEIDRLLGLADEMDVPCTLIRFTAVAPGALRAATSALQRGARDAVCTEHDGCIWSFLFGCPPDHADAVMARLLGARFESLLAGWQRISGARDVTRALRLLDTAVQSPEQALFQDTLVRINATLDDPEPPTTSVPPTISQSR